MVSHRSGTHEQRISRVILHPWLFLALFRFFELLPHGTFSGACPCHEFSIAVLRTVFCDSVVLISRRPGTLEHRISRVILHPRFLKRRLFECFLMSAKSLKRSKKTRFCSLSNLSDTILIMPYHYGISIQERVVFVRFCNGGFISSRYVWEGIARVTYAVSLHAKKIGPCGDVFLWASLSIGSCCWLYRVATLGTGYRI